MGSGGCFIASSFELLRSKTKRIPSITSVFCGTNPRRGERRTCLARLRELSKRSLSNPRFGRSATRRASSATSGRTTLGTIITRFPKVAL
ncbi:hypothetical protein BSKO_10695 [Bryopsis sp. KO-2023]|nr:hypothetical protein BSKO_10695 [Bryopsis sp. KO-2023]